MNEKRTKGVRIRVPASTSNLGSAFNSIGLALQLYLTLEMQTLLLKADNAGLVVEPLL